MRITARPIFRLVLLFGLAILLALNFPGQLSWDSVGQLHEGRFGTRDTWGPVVYSVILGVFDRIAPGTGLYLLASALLLIVALAALPGLRPRTVWAAPIAAALFIGSPLFLIYQGDIWKDVLFANLVVASFVLLAHVARVWPVARRPWLALAGLVLMLALAAQVRQNGVIVAPFAALVLAWSVRTGGWRAMVGWAGGGLAAVVLLSQALAGLALPAGVGADKGFQTGLQLLQGYDIAGVLAHDRAAPLQDIAAADPQVERMMRARGVALYSPQRVDFMMFDEALSAALKGLPQGVLDRQWRHLIVRRPGAYLAHRADAFRWVFLTPVIDKCLPIYTGVDGIPDQMRDLGLEEGSSPAADALENYATHFLATPVYSHLTYALAALVVAVLLLWRRDPQDVAIAGLMLAALAFAASFAAISIACDYRYLYLLDLAAIAGVIYLAIDPPMPWKRTT